MFKCGVIIALLITSLINNTSASTDDNAYYAVAKYMYIFGYIVSCGSLSFAIGLNIYYMNVRSRKIILHILMYATFLLDIMLYLVWKFTVEKRYDVILNNELWCICLKITTTYLHSARYTWLCIELYFKYLAVTVVFNTDCFMKRNFLWIGWLSPTLATTFNAVARIASGDTDRCWSDERLSFITISIPVSVTVGMALCFIYAMIKALKVQRVPIANLAAPTKISKLIWLNLFVIVIYGFQYALTPFYQMYGPREDTFVDLFVTFITSFQGFWIATLFCFCDREIIAAIEKKRNKRIRIKRLDTMIELEFIAKKARDEEAGKMEDAV